MRDERVLAGAGGNHVRGLFRIGVQPSLDPGPATSEQEVGVPNAGCKPVRLVELHQRSEAPLDRPAGGRYLPEVDRHRGGEGSTLLRRPVPKHQIGGPGAIVGQIDDGEESGDRECNPSMPAASTVCTLAGSRLAVLLTSSRRRPVILARRTTTRSSRVCTNGP